MHILEVLDDDLGVELSNNLVAIMAMSVRILLISQDRCWTVGSLPYLLILALPSSDLPVSERLSSLASPSDHSLSRT